MSIKDTNNVIRTIINMMENKNEVTEHIWKCDECGVDNVWDLSFNLFCCHIHEHRDRRSQHAVDEEGCKQTSSRARDYTNPITSK